MFRSPDYYRERAEELRAMAEDSVLRSTSDELQWMAAMWDEVAEAAETRDAAMPAIRDPKHR
jgi:hypothetical protein